MHKILERIRKKADIIQYLTGLFRRAHCKTNVWLLSGGQIPHQRLSSLVSVFDVWKHFKAFGECDVAILKLSAVEGEYTSLPLWRD